jgi:hypothetical protein
MFRSPWGQGTALSSPHRPDRSPLNETAVRARESKIPRGGFDRSRWKGYYINKAENNFLPQNCETIPKILSVCPHWGMEMSGKERAKEGQENIRRKLAITQKNGAKLPTPPCKV